MKTGIAMAKDVFSLVNIPAVTDLITGRAYLFERPANSDKSDLVVNTLALTNAQLQNGLVNVNFHAPNLKGVVLDGETDNTLPDISALDAACNAVIAILKDYVGEDFTLAAQNTGIPVRDVDGTWYINIRVGYNAFQQNYSNI